MLYCSDVSECAAAAEEAAAMPKVSKTAIYCGVTAKLIPCVVWKFGDNGIVGSVLWWGDGGPIVE